MWNEKHVSHLLFLLPVVGPSTPKSVKSEPQGKAEMRAQSYRLHLRPICPQYLNLPFYLIFDQ
jgi:hypothetical protein